MPQSTETSCNWIKLEEKATEGEGGRREREREKRENGGRVSRTEGASLLAPYSRLEDRSSPQLLEGNRNTGGVRPHHRTQLGDYSMTTQ